MPLHSGCRFAKKETVLPGTGAPVSASVSVARGLMTIFGDCRGAMSYAASAFIAVTCRLPKPERSTCVGELGALIGTSNVADADSSEDGRNLIPMRQLLAGATEP